MSSEGTRQGVAVGEVSLVSSVKNPATFPAIMAVAASPMTRTMIPLKNNIVCVPLTLPEIFVPNHASAKRSVSMAEAVSWKKHGISMSPNLLKKLWKS